MLDAGLDRFTDAPNTEKVRALLYRAELAVRVGDGDLAARSLADARSVDLTADESDLFSDELAHATELVDGTEGIDATAGEPASPGR